MNDEFSSSIKRTISSAREETRKNSLTDEVHCILLFDFHK